MVPLPRIRDFEAMLQYFLQRHQQVQAQLARTQQAQTPQTTRSQAQAQQHGIPYVNRLASNLNVTNNGQPAPSNDAQQQRTAVDNQPAASLANSTVSASASVAGMFEPPARTRTNGPPAVEPWIPVNSQPREQARPNPILGAPRAVAGPPTASRASIKQESGPEQSKASASKPGQPTAVTAAAPSFPRPGQGFRIEKNQTRRVTQFGIRFGQASLSLQQFNTQPRPQHQQQQLQQRPHDLRAVRVQTAQPSTGASATAGPATATTPAPARELASRPQVPAAPIVHRLPPRPPTLKFPLSGKALTTHFLAIRKDPYAVLGIHRNATAEQIKQAYRKACMQHHPDKNAEDREGALERFHVVTQAYGVLKEEENRGEYDRKVRMGKGVGGA
ncbi:hypothetical protein W97_04574 [Coniosporium apollinis CBS 100218]|uniref:J domain-containing protein n=1 Tax=Coniosporium apollinis (strain CBS 100218) TaxID=1168221 RepID=R7YUH8_CONA1|nr:uncharacterized protein W97_04574 [Coniosporium apollinis CBS 100218]EON65336.1 hypothetical protein W97_04574 [Coniosporium apollinis CBS 100218]